MEVKGVNELFIKSVNKYNVCYVNYLRDGDTES